MNGMRLDEAVADRAFTFFRANGSIIAPHVTLIPDGRDGIGRIHGTRSSNEFYWRIEAGRLLFLNQQEQVTTSFAHVLWQASGAMFLGSFLPVDANRVHHILCDHACRDDVGRLLAMLDDLAQGARETATDRRHEQIIRKAVLTEQTLNLVARRASLAGRRTLRCLFLVHNIEAWDSLAALHERMRDSEDFIPIVATLPRRPPGTAWFGEEQGNHDGLDQLGVPHVRLTDKDPFNDLSLVKSLNPDIIFRQAPWDRDVPDAFHPCHLAFARLCYVQYGGFHLNQNYYPDDRSADRDLAHDQPYHRACWRIFCEAESQAAAFRSRGVPGGGKLVVTGHPKLDRLAEAKRRPQWPIASGRERPFRLIWAPHHSLTPNWLGFGTFLTCYRDMLDWAASDPDIQIVLKPHPGLFTFAVAHGLMSGTELSEFRNAWEALPNAMVVGGGDYGPLLAASDAMLTDGISFLAEYQIFDKPIVFLDSGHHVPFNQVGDLVMTATHTVRNVSEARDLLHTFRRGASDPKASLRPNVMAALMPHAGASVDRIMDALRSGMVDEGWTMPAAFGPVTDTSGLMASQPAVTRPP